MDIFGLSIFSTDVTVIVKVFDFNDNLVFTKEVTTFEAWEDTRHDLEKKFNHNLRVVSVNIFDTSIRIGIYEF